MTNPDQSTTGPASHQASTTTSADQTTTMTHPDQTTVANPHRTAIMSSAEEAGVSPLRTTPAVHRAGILRAGLVVASAAALVLVAGHTDVRGQLAAPHEQAGLPERSTVLVTSAVLACPGQMRVGTQGLRDVSGTVPVAAAAAPEAALVGTGAGATGDGRVALLARAGAVLGSTADRAVTARTTISDSDPVLVRGDGVLAPGVVAAQGWLRTGDDDRGLALTSCSQPAPEAWLLGGGGGPSRTERVVITNPGANPVGVRLEVFGAEGRVAGGQGGMTVPPRARVAVSLDALAPKELRPAVHVIATGGVVSAVLGDAWIDGATARGVADVAAATAPSRDLLIAGVDPAPEGAGDTMLRLVNPDRTEVLARVTVLTGAGPTQPEGLRAVRVPPGATLDVPLRLAPGSTGLRIAADLPITASAFVERRQTSGADREGDFAWLPATAAVSVTGGAVIPDLGRSGTTRTLHLAAGAAGATVVSVVGSGTPTRTVTTVLPAESTAKVDLGAADRVWVRTAAPDLHAAVSLGFSVGGVPYYDVLPIVSAPTTETVVPVRQVAN